MKGLPGELFPIRADVVNDSELTAAVQAVHEKWGTIDTVFANAGFGVVGNAAELSLADYQRQFDTNVYGVLRTLSATLADLKATRGRFAVTGSVAGYISLPGGAAYSMSKFAIRALCDALYLELRPAGIGVTHLAPGFVHSEIHEVDNLGRHHAGAKHYLPDWIRVKTPVAGREIFRAIEARRRERVITGHGKLLKILNQFFPGLVRLLVGSMALKARPSVNHHSKS